MAELATIARPYAEAAFAAVRDAGVSPAQAADTLDRIAQVTSDPALREVVGSPKVSARQLADLVLGVVPAGIAPALKNLIEMLAENRRLAAMPQIAEQFRVLKDEAEGKFEAVVTSAFPLEGEALDSLLQALERKYGRKLHATVEIDPSLIGGVRVAVGDEVLDTSVRARLEQMKVALTA
ncbi:MAG: F0F1 ATP synthase subunit delta [Thiomonas sp.]|nr:F0F1 ATP synthase subunit delta [Thiomonas sp.]